MSHNSPLDKSTHLHEHRQGDAKHQHYFTNRSQSVLAWAMALTLFFALIETVFGFISNSLALISDAGHMMTDSAALGLALLAQLLAKRKPNATHSFGFGRSEALAAFVNGLFMLAIITWIAKEAILRLSNPEPVQGGIVMIVAVIGLVINIIVAWVLSHDKESMNTKAALIHVMGDLLGSVAAILAGTIIYYTNWLPIDPLLSLFVALLILKSTIEVLKESFHFLMKGVPRHINYIQVGADLEAITGIISVHDLHVWDMSPGQTALIGHVEIEDIKTWPFILSSIQTMLLERHGIDHITIQAEICLRENKSSTNKNQQFH